MKNLTLIKGDCAKVLTKIKSETIDLTVTSPPYDNLRSYKGYSFDFHKIANELFRVTKVGGVLVWVVNDATIKGSETGTSFRQALHFIDCGFNLHDTMIYDKGGVGGAKGSSLCYSQSFEYMFVFSKGRPKSIELIKDRPNASKGTSRKTKSLTSRLSNGKIRKRESEVVTSEFGKRTNVWRIPSGFMQSTQDKIAFKHPAIFPEALARDHINTWSKPGDVVLDIFSGSGTTAKAALQARRKFIGIEISEDYINLSKERLKPVIRFIKCQTVAKKVLGVSFSSLEQNTHTFNIKGKDYKPSAKLRTEKYTIFMDCTKLNELNTRLKRRMMFLAERGFSVIFILGNGDYAIKSPSSKIKITSKAHSIKSFLD